MRFHEYEKTVLNENGWEIEAEHPLEIHNDAYGGYAVGYAAEFILKALLQIDAKSK